MNAILIASGIEYEAKKQVQYILDIAKWAFCIDHMKKTIKSFCPKSQRWTNEIKNLLLRLKSMQMIKDENIKFVMDLYHNSYDITNNKKEILDCIRETTKINDNPTLIVASGHSSPFGFCLPNSIRISAEEISINICGKTLLVYDACFGNIYQKICENNSLLTVITHPLENFSYTTKELFNKSNPDLSIRLGGILTRLLLEKIHSDDILKEINILRETKVIWEYATEDENEKSFYQNFGEGNLLLFLFPFLKQCRISLLLCSDIIDDKIMALWGN